MDRKRLEVFRQILAKRFTQRPSVEQPSITPEMISEAVATGVSQGLGKYATKSGALKISDVKGWSPVGGG